MDPALLEHAPESVQAFARRWAPIYGTSPLFKHTVTAYRAAWDDDSDAGCITMREIAQDLYDQAVAAGHDVTQVCPRCKAPATCAETLSAYTHCPACEAADEARAAAHRVAVAEARRQREAWLASLPPEERDAIIEAERVAMQLNLMGLFRRDAQ